MAKHTRRLSWPTLLLLFGTVLALTGASSDTKPRPRYPDQDIGADSLPARKQAQLETEKQFKVFYQFHFTDKLKESGITFVNHAVDDVTLHMKAGHYDHGTGIAVADVDGDGLYDVYFVNQVGGNELWKNLGGGKFKNITKEAGVGLPGRISVGAAFADVDNDGSEDLFVTTVRGGNVLFKNDGHGHFKDVTEEAGVGLVAHSSGAFFFDYDNGGLLSVYFLNMQGSNSYYENEGGKKFADKTAQYFPRTPWGAMGIKFFDFDNDGRMDLLITDMHSDMSQEPSTENEKLKSTITWTDSYLQGKKSDFIFGNALYHNLGDGKIEEVSDKMGVENYWPWGVSVGDINADGWDDIFIASGMSFPYRYGINSLLLNNRGTKFLDSEFILGIEPRKNLYTPWFEIDCSGPDAKLGMNTGTCAGQSGKITAMAPRSSRSSVMFDLDNDGDLDIITNDMNSEPQVFISDLAQRKHIHWLKVVLVGTTSNRDGLGATVRVHAGGQTYMKYNDGKSGYLSQSALPLYFGLGGAVKIDSVEVSWPSGRKQVLSTGLEENRMLQITEPK